MIIGFIWGFFFADGAPYTWWVGRSGDAYTYWAGAPPGTQQCACAVQDNCVDPEHSCNCDRDLDDWYCGFISTKITYPLAASDLKALYESIVLLLPESYSDRDTEGHSKWINFWCSHHVGITVITNFESIKKALVSSSNS